MDRRHVGPILLSFWRASCPQLFPKTYLMSTMFTTRRQGLASQYLALGILNITLKYLLEIIFLFVGWCLKKNGHSSIHLLIFITYSNPPQSLCWSSLFTKPWRICTGSRLHPPRAPRLHRRRGAAPAGRPGGGRCNNGLLELRWASPCRGTRGGAASAARGEGGAVRGEDGDLW